MAERGATERRVGYLIKRAQQALRNAMDQALREYRVTTPQYAVLTFLAEEPGLSSAELARRAFVTPQTMNEVLAKLEVDGLVARAADPRHSRILRTRLTAAGARILAACHERVDAIEAQMVSALDAEEQERLAETLERCVEALRSPFATDPPTPVPPARSAGRPSPISAGV
jgi:DNA-binding MarR family transcriptional regulator